jgi:hypothetical protein
VSNRQNLLRGEWSKNVIEQHIATMLVEIIFDMRLLKEANLAIGHIFVLER